MIPCWRTVNRKQKSPLAGAFRAYASLRAIYAADSSTLSSSSPVKAALLELVL
jgi:hypothetical protein